MSGLISPQNKNDRVFRPSRSKLFELISLNANPQLACATGAAVAAFFFWIARFRSSAFGDRFSALAFSKNVSRPPLWSTVLIALVETRRRTLWPSASEMQVTLHRFGMDRRLHM